MKSGKKQSRNARRTLTLESQELARARGGATTNGDSAVSQAVLTSLIRARQKMIET